MKAKRTTISQPRLEELLRKERYFDNVLTAVSTYSTSDVAALLGISAVSLNKMLDERKIIKKEGEFWTLRAKYVGMGLVKSPTTLISDEAGDLHTKIVTRWTEKGRLFIWELFNSPDEEESKDDC